jgi:hypothetical protein
MILLCMSQRCQWHRCAVCIWVRYPYKIRKGFNPCIRGPGEVVWREKKQRSNISCEGPFNFSAHWDYVKRLGLVDNNLLGMPRKPILAVRQYRFDSHHKIKLVLLNFICCITYNYCIVLVYSNNQNFSTGWTLKLHGNIAALQAFFQNSWTVTFGAFIF